MVLEGSVRKSFFIPEDSVVKSILRFHRLFLSNPELKNKTSQFAFRE